MNKEIFKDKKVLTVASVVIVILVIFLIRSNDNGNEEKFIVERRNLEEVVRISGRVEAGTVSEIGFDVAGTINKTFIKVNDSVVLGQSLIGLNLGTLTSELESARADLFLKQIQYNESNDESGTVAGKQNALVESAYTKLLSSDIVVEPQNEAYTQTPPIITGRYLGSEGTYKVTIKIKQAGTFELRTSLLESTNIKISDTAPTPLGTKGLFIEFPDTLGDYKETSWFINIPNKKSASYLANFNAYQEALREQDKESSPSIAEAELAKARANVNKIETQIVERTLRAPFSGTITQVTADPGEAVSANQAIVTIISPDLGIEIDLPEIDSIRVSNNDEASVSFDAIGNVQFMAKVITVNRTETFVDGIPIYEARLVLIEKDPRIVSGMTAEVSIMTNRRENVLSIPIRAVNTRDGGRYVLLETSGGTTETEIQTGLQGTNGFIEIISGLTEGDIVISSL